MSGLFRRRRPKRYLTYHGEEHHDGELKHPLRQSGQHMPNQNDSPTAEPSRISHTIAEVDGRVSLGEPGPSISRS
jgi:hypothetical protein